MFMKPSPETTRRFLIFVLVCTAAGFLNGLLGAGGGILLVWALGSLSNDTSGIGVRDTFAATLAAVIPITALSAVLYGRENVPDIAVLSPLLLPAILGGAVGALLLGKIPTGLLKKIFAVLVLYSGISMVIR